jgi:hypothetical protein
MFCNNTQELSAPRTTFYSDEITHVYIASGLNPTCQRLDMDEILKVMYYPFDQTLRMVADWCSTNGLKGLTLKKTWLYLFAQSATGCEVPHGRICAA